MAQQIMVVNKRLANSAPILGTYNYRMDHYCRDEMKYQIATTIKTIAGIRPIIFLRLFGKLDFFSSFFIFLTGSAVRFMVILFDMVVPSFFVVLGTAMALHIWESLDQPAA